MSIKAYDGYAVPAENVLALCGVLNELAEPVMRARYDAVASELVSAATHRWVYTGPPYDGDPEDTDASIRHLLRHASEGHHETVDEITPTGWLQAVWGIAEVTDMSEHQRRLITPAVGKPVSLSVVGLCVEVIQKVTAASPYRSSGDASMRIDFFTTPASPGRALMRPVAEGKDPWKGLLDAPEARDLGVREWAYWNNSDPDEDVPEEEWAERGRDWRDNDLAHLSWSAPRPMSYRARIDPTALPLVVAEEDPAAQ